MRATLNYLILAIIINVVYCGLSEKYIHDGLFVDGVLFGVLSSVLCMLIGYLAVKALIKLDKGVYYESK